MDRPIGALLLMWPTWWALWLAAKDFPPIGPLVIFTLGVFAMRSAGCAINDYADRKLDPQVARTAGRPIASGRVTPREALAIFGGLLLFSFILVLFTNKLTILLSFAGAALAAIYPFTKRYTNLPQVVLGAAFGWSIPMAFAAVTNTVPPVAWLLFIANILWSVIYDTEYAMVDRDEDIKAGAKSTAILFADADLVIIGVLHGHVPAGDAARGNAFGAGLAVLDRPVPSPPDCSATSNGSCATVTVPHASPPFVTTTGSGWHSGSASSSPLPCDRHHSVKRPSSFRSIEMGPS